MGRKSKIVPELIIESKQAPEKVNKWWALAITIVLIIIALIIMTTRLTPKAEASQSHREWGNWSNWGQWSECRKRELKTLEVVDEQCGEIKGTQSRERTRTCHNDNGNGQNQCSFVGQVDTDTQHRDCTIEVACPTPTPEVTPEVTPEPTPVPAAPCTQNCGNPPTFAGSSTEPPRCGSDNVTKEPANPHVYRKGDKAIVKWFPTAGNKVHILYKQNTSPDWQYSFITDNLGYAEINGLDSMDITFAVQQVWDCGGGIVVSAPSLPIVDGPSDHWVLYR
jgi:hypothetical protein